MSELISLGAQLDDARREIARLKEELAAFREDKERLDWMDKNRSAHIYSHFKFNSSNACNQKTWRLAIDAARKDKK